MYVYIYIYIYIRPRTCSSEDSLGIGIETGAIERSETAIACAPVETGRSAAAPSESATAEARRAGSGPTCACNTQRGESC